jgi:hypothetical protein
VAIFTDSKHVIWYLKMVTFSFFKTMYFVGHIYLIYCCHGNSIQFKKRYCLNKRIKCPTIKTPLEGPFCYLVYPHYNGTTALL